MAQGISRPDPYSLAAGAAGTVGSGAWTDIAGLSVRSAAINPALKTLVLITFGQSQLGNVMPSAFVPTNAAVIDQISLFDGALYNVAGRLLGCTNSSSPSCVGNIAAKVADLLVTNVRFDRVIIGAVAVGGTTMDYWASGGSLSDRLTVIMRRLAARGITTATPGVTFAALVGIGESDGSAGTLAATYTANFNSAVSVLNGAGFSGRYFLTRETWLGGVTYATIQNAQVALVDNVNIFSGGDWDSLNAANRQADNTHFNDVGGLAAALLAYNAMHASGAPF